MGWKTKIRGTESLRKDRRLKDALVPLGEAVSDLEVCDHWESDLVAIGLAVLTVPGMLVYVSCWQLCPGHVYFTIEIDEMTVEEADDVPLAQFICALKRHIARARRISTASR